MLATGPTSLDLHTSGVRKPKYERLKSHLQGELLAGRFQPGDALPSEEQLADIFQIARTTVRQALAMLEDDGLVRRIRGRGTFVEERATQRVKTKSDTVALVVPDLADAPYVQSVLHGFEDKAKQHRCQVLVFSTNEDVGKQADILMRVGDQGVGGVVLWPTAWGDTPAYHLRHLQQRDVPVVLCHRPVEGARAPLVWVSYQEIARMIGEALAHQGHRRLALFTGHPSLASRTYEETLRKVMEESGGSLPEQCVYCGEAHTLDYVHEAATAALEQMMSLPERPTALVTSFLDFDQVLHSHLVKMGLRIPDEISLVTIGNSRRPGYVSPRPTMVGIDAVALGRRAAEVLNEMRLGQRPIDDNERISMPLEFIEGETLGPAAKHS